MSTEIETIGFAILGPGMVADYHAQAINANADLGARLVAIGHYHSGRFADIGEEVQAELARQRGGRAIAMNIDGATAVIFCELGFPAPLSRGLFCLSRSVGILAHAWEQMQQGGRNKGPMPPRYLPLYEPSR